MPTANRGAPGFASTIVRGLPFLRGGTTARRLDGPTGCQEFSFLAPPQEVQHSLSTSIWVAGLGCCLQNLNLWRLDSSAVPHLLSRAGSESSRGTTIRPQRCGRPQLALFDTPRTSRPRRRGAALWGENGGPRLPMLGVGPVSTKRASRDLLVRRLLPARCHGCCRWHRPTRKRKDPSKIAARRATLNRHLPRLATLLTWMCATQGRRHTID